MRGPDSFESTAEQALPLSSRASTVALAIVGIESMFCVSLSSNHFRAKVCGRSGQIDFASRATHKLVYLVCLPCSNDEQRASIESRDARMDGVHRQSGSIRISSKETRKPQQRMVVAYGWCRLYSAPMVNMPHQGERLERSVNGKDQASQCRNGSPIVASQPRQYKPVETC
jgi:hypothetical protein